MSFEIKWNPNFKRDLEREVNANMERALRRAAPTARCPDHPDHRFTVGHGSKGPKVATCCDRGLKSVMKKAGL